MTCPTCAAETGSAAACPACGAAIESPGLAPGTLVAGRYEVVGRLGAGGMGVVYKARDRLLDEVVALKVLRPDVTGSGEMAARFRSEIRLARAVSHRNVCRIHEYGEEGALRYVSMAFVEGVDLRRVLLDRGPLSGEETAAVATQVAEALEAIHDQGIVHRDLKPGNIMMDGRGVARVMDFGIAKQWDSAGAAGVTGTGQLVGTPLYMSPEQIRGEPLDGRSDLYSLGIVVYELVTGRVPFRGNTPMATLYKHVHEPPPLKGPDAAMLPSALIPVLERALAKDRAARFPTAREMAAALRQARAAGAGDVPSVTRTIAPGAPATTASPAITAAPAANTASAAGVALGTVSVDEPRRVSRWPLVFISVAGTMAVLVAIAAGVVARWGRAPAAAPPPPTISGPAPTILSASAAVAPPPIAPAPRGETPATAVVRGAVVPRSPRPLPSAARAGEEISSAAAIAGLLAEADAALADHATDVAASLYDQVLAIDAANERARAGRARVAEALARSTTPVTGSARFVAGHTRIDSAATRPSAPAGFEGSAGIAVRRIDQAPSVGAKIYFEVTPPAVAPGDRYRVRAYLVNESKTAIDLSDMTVTTAVNGRRAGGHVDVPSRQLAPEQRSLLLDAQDVWHAETTSWTMTVTVRTAGGESFTNQLTWP